MAPGPLQQMNPPPPPPRAPDPVQRECSSELAAALLPVLLGFLCQSC